MLIRGYETRRTDSFPSQVEALEEVFSHLMIGTNLNNHDPILKKKIHFIKSNLLKIDQNFIL